jgi:AcrR family transcriptional regulator
LTLVEQPETGVRRRTRQAIVAAAVDVWARDWNAPLGEIADRAGTSRSTLHRYFADRQSLVDAALAEALGRLGEVGSVIDRESAASSDLLVGMLRSLGQIAHAVLFLYADPARFAGNPGWTGEDESQDEMLTLVRRGQAEGRLDDEVPAEWLLSAYYSLLYAAADLVVSGSMSAQAAGDAAARTFRRGLGGPG